MVVMKIGQGKNLVSVNLHVDDSSFAQANEEGEGMYYLADKGSMLYEILEQCGIEFYFNGNQIEPTGCF